MGWSDHYRNSPFPDTRRCFPFPYTLATSEWEMENICEYPEKESFYNDLTKEAISESDYAFGREVWEALSITVGGKKHMNLKVLHSWYLHADVLLLADIWTWLGDLMKKDFNVHPGSFITGSGMGYEAAPAKGQTHLELLSDHAHYLSFSNLLKGGFVSLTRRYAKANNVECDNYNPQKPESFIISLDWNSLYPWLLTKNLPYGDFRTEECPEKFTEAYIMSLDTSDEAERRYVIDVDMEIGQHLPILTDDLPLGLVNSTGIRPSPTATAATAAADEMTPPPPPPPLADEKKLVAGHFDLCEYSPC